jgi:hypothetical protein
MRSPPVPLRCCDAEAKLNQKRDRRDTNVAVTDHRVPYLSILADYHAK